MDTVNPELVGVFVFLADIRDDDGFIFFFEHIEGGGCVPFARVVAEEFVDDDLVGDGDVNFPYDGAVGELVEVFSIFPYF